MVTLEISKIEYKTPSYVMIRMVKEMQVNYSNIAGLLRQIHSFPGQATTTAFLELGAALEQLLLVARTLE